MSLINDALKRAKQAQQNTAQVSVPVLQLRPVELAPAPPVSPSRASGLLVPGGVALAVLVALVFCWQHIQRGSSPQVRIVQAKTSPEKSTVSPAAPVIGPSRPQASLTTRPASQATGAAKAPNPPAKSVPAAQPVPTAQLSLPKETNQTATLVSETPATPPPPAEPAILASLRLQSIIYTPRRPSALISGRIVYVGDKFGDLRVTQINRSTVTLVGLGTTNLLDLLQ